MLASAGCNRLFIEGATITDWNNINPQIAPEINGGRFFKIDIIIFIQKRYKNLKWSISHCKLKITLLK